jgi:hypothetical protein
MALASSRKFSTKQYLIVALMLAIALVVYAVASHAGGSGNIYYKPPLKKIKNVNATIKSGTVNGMTGMQVTWDRPSDWSKVKVYKFYRGNQLVGSFATEGSKTPAKTSTFLQGTFSTLDNITIQSEADSASTPIKIKSATPTSPTPQAHCSGGC